MKYAALIITAILLLISCSPNKFRSELDFGNKLSSEGLWNEAEYWWKRSVKKNGETAATLNNMGVFYEQKSQLEKALEHYKRAQKLSPGNRYIKLNIERVTRRLGKKPEAPDKKKGAENEK